MPDPAVHAGLEAATVEAREVAGDLVRKERVMAGGDETLGDAPDVFVGGHPVEAIEGRETDGEGVGAEGALAAQVVIVLEVAESQLAEGAVDGGAETEAGEVGLGEASPEAALAVEGDDMVVVVDGFEVHKQRRAALDAEGGGGEHCSLHAVALALAEDTGGRPGSVGVLVFEAVEETLDAGGGVEGAEGAEIAGREAEVSGVGTALPA